MSEREKKTLARFGCTFEERAGVIFIDWRGRTVAEAASADILACLGNLESEAGPLAFIAIEISLIRPLPEYCYFPFNLMNPRHRTRLDEFLQSGQIKLRFHTGKRTVERIHQVTPYVRSRASEIYERALKDLETHGAARYKFEDALQLLERWVRIPVLFERLLSEDALAELTMRIKQAVQSVPNEKRQFAHRLVRDATAAFGPYYQSHEKSFVEVLRRAHTGLTYVADLHRLFAYNPTGFNEFFGDGIAASFSLPELENLSELLKIAIALPQLPFQNVQTAAESEPQLDVPEVPAGLGTLVQSMVSQGISKDSVKKFTELIGLRTGGRSGRPPKDYRREYELKASGKSWTQVARQILEDDPDVRTEFNERSYDSLSFEEQETLKHRIREGVKSFAKRIGKPSASARGTEETNPAKGEQKIR